MDDVPSSVARDFFDPTWYIERNPDVAFDGRDPFDHYCELGWSEGRWPNPIFDPLWYRRTYEDVAKEYGEPLTHFVRHGRFEGRRPSPEFDPLTYLRLHADVAAQGIEPSEHYLLFGRFEGRAFVDDRDAPRTTVHHGSRQIGHASSAALRSALSELRDVAALPAAGYSVDLTEECVAALVEFDAERIDWRARVLAKHFYEVDIAYRPVPDGLSLSYIEIADRLNNGELSSAAPSYEARIDDGAGDVIDAVEALAQREIGEAVKNEYRLLSSGRSAS